MCVEVMVWSVVWVVVVGEGYGGVVKVGDGMRGDLRVGCNEEVERVIEVGRGVGRVGSMGSVVEGYEVVEVVCNVGRGVGDVRWGDGRVSVGMRVWVVRGVRGVGVVVEMDGVVVWIVVVVECKEDRFEVLVRRMEGVVCVR